MREPAGFLPQWAVSCSTESVRKGDLMSAIAKALWNDENGVILSAELVLVGTILVLGVIVGLVELQCAVVGELSDLGDSIGNFDQTYVTSGIRSLKVNGGIKGLSAGSAYWDAADECDCNLIIVCDNTFGGGEKVH